MEPPVPDKKNYEARIREWGVKLDSMKARAEKMAAQAKLEIKPRVEAVQTKLDTAKTKVGNIAKVTDGKWVDITRGVENRWSGLKASIDGVYSGIRRNEKK
jgi:hypothetical protein